MSPGGIPSLSCSKISCSQVDPIVLRLGRSFLRLKLKMVFFSLYLLFSVGTSLLSAELFNCLFIVAIVSVSSVLFLYIAFLLYFSSPRPFYSLRQINPLFLYQISKVNIDHYCLHFPPLFVHSSGCYMFFIKALF